MSARLAIALAGAVCVWVGALPMSSEAVAAVESSGTISGIVTDSRTKDPIPNALVVLQCTCLEGSRETTTNTRGVYAFRDLPPGTYTIQVLSGQADVSKVTTLQDAAKFRANFSLDPRSEFKRAVRVSSRAVPMSTSTGPSVQEFMDLERSVRSSGSSPVEPRESARDKLAEYRRETIALREVESSPEAAEPASASVEPPLDKPVAEVTPATEPLPKDFARQVVYSGTMELAVFKREKAKEEIEALVTQAGGYVQSLKPTSMVLRIPADDFRAIAAKIGKLGRIESQEFEALDVTTDYYDLATRIEVLRRTESQLLALLGQARSVKEALEVRRELDKVVMELEEALGRQRVMAAMVRYSVLSLALTERVERTDAPSTNDPFPWVDELGVEGTAWR